MGARFNKIAMLLESARIMTSRGLAINPQHFWLAYVKKGVTQQMNKIDEKRGKNGRPLVNEDDVLHMARVKEKAIIIKEAKYRSANVEVPLRLKFWAEGEPKIFEEPPPRPWQNAWDPKFHCSPRVWGPSTKKAHVMRGGATLSSTALANTGTWGSACQNFWQRNNAIVARAKTMAATEIMGAAKG